MLGPTPVRMWKFAFAVPVRVGRDRASVWRACPRADSTWARARRTSGFWLRTSLTAASQPAKAWLAGGTGSSMGSFTCGSSGRAVASAGVSGIGAAAAGAGAAGLCARAGAARPPQVTSGTRRLPNNDLGRDRGVIPPGMAAVGRGGKPGRLGDSGLLLPAREDLFGARFVGVDSG